MADENIVRLVITSSSHTAEKNNGCIVESGLPRSASLEMHLDKLLTRIAPFETSLQSASLVMDVELSVVIYADSRPPLNFSKAVIRALDRIGASLDIDLYLTRES